MKNLKEKIENQFHGYSPENIIKFETPISYNELREQDLDLIQDKQFYFNTLQLPVEGPDAKLLQHSYMS